MDETKEIVHVALAQIKSDYCVESSIVYAGTNLKQAKFALSTSSCDKRIISSWVNGKELKRIEQEGKGTDEPWITTKDRIAELNKEIDKLKSDLRYKEYELKLLTITEDEEGNNHEQ